MNRQQRINLPSVDSVLTSMNSVLRDIARKEENGCLDVDAARVQLNGLQTNLLRLEGDVNLPAEMLKNAVDSIEMAKQKLVQDNVVDENSSTNDDRFDSTVPNGHGRGRNVVDIDMDKLKQLIQLGYTVKHIAKDGLLGGVLHPNTLYKKMKEHGIKFHSTEINDEELRTIIGKYNRDHPNSGSSEIQAYLKSQGIFIQRHRCRSLLSSVDAMGTALTWSTTIQRRVYNVPTANSIWHVDTHHSLKRWSIIVHGGIDGHSRLVSFLRASTCNTSKAAACFFVEGVNTYGMPSRLRADHGTEFADVGRFMIRVNGEERGSFLTGPSVHNQRIERLWRDVFSKVLDTFYKLFIYMEEQKIYDHADDLQKWVLQYVFCARIDRALKQWMNTHNCHKIRTENNKTPSMLWTQSLVDGDDKYTAIRNARQPPQEAISDAITDLNIDMDSLQFQKPRVPCPVSEECLREMASTIDILKPSDCHGLDVYGEVVTFVRRHHTRD